MLLLLNAFWPGLITVNGELYFDQIVVHQFPLEHIQYKSPIYRAFLFFLLNFGHSFYYVFLAQIFLAALTLAYSYFIATKYFGKVWPMLWILFFILIPTNSLMLIQTERETLQAWMGLLGLIQLIHITLDQLEGKQIGWSRIFALCLTLIFTAFIRPEAILYAAILPLQMAILAPTQKWKIGCKFLVGISVSFLVVNGALKVFTDYSSRDSIKLGNTVEYMIRQSLFVLEERGGTFSEEDKRALEPYVYLNALNEIEADNEIAIRNYYLPRINTDENYQALKTYFINLIINSPITYLTARMRQFLKTLKTGIPQSTPTFQNKLSRWPELKSAYLKVINLNIESPFLHHIFLSLTGALGIMLLLALFTPWLYKFWILGAAPALHLVLIALLQTTGKARYFYFTQIAIMFFSPIIVLAIVKTIKRFMKFRETIDDR